MIISDVYVVNAVFKKLSNTVLVKLIVAELVKRFLEIL
jgi:hypothetical protein